MCKMEILKVLLADSAAKEQVFKFFFSSVVKTTRLDKMTRKIGQKTFGHY